MPSVSSLGARSGLDLEGIVNATLEAERVPKENQLNEKEERLQVELSAVGEMQSVLSTLQDAAKELSEGDVFRAMKASVEQPESGDVITVESTEDAGVGNFDISVTQLAQGSRAVSADGAFANSEDEVNTNAGSLTFGAGDESFTLNIEAGSSLEDIRKAVNSSEDNFGVTADIINTGTEAKLIFRSNLSGEGNDLTVTNDNAEFDAISTQANGGAPGSGGMTIADADKATDAIIEIDGIQARNDTNTFEDVIQGSTITAVKESEDAETAELSIARDEDGIEKSINAFVKAYNGVVASLNEIGGEGSMLQGDATVRNLKGQLNDVLTSTFGEGGKTLFDLGFGLDEDGKLETENPVTSFNEVLEENPLAFESLLGGENGLAGRMDSFVDGYVKDGGSLDMREDSIDQGLERVTKSREDLALRMESMEETLRAKYQALDQLVGQLQSSGNSLSGQLANLPGFTSNNS